MDKIVHQPSPTHHCEPPTALKMEGGRSATYLPHGTLWQCRCGKFYRAVQDSRSLCIWKQTSRRRVDRMLRKSGV